MNLHNAVENKLFSTVAHGQLNEHYETDIRELFSELKVLETSLENYQSISLRRKQERLKHSSTLFRVYWQNALKTLLPYCVSAELNSPRLFMRYGLVHISDIAPEDCEALQMVPLHSSGSCLVFYTDEWFHNISSGAVPPLQPEGAQVKPVKKEPEKNGKDDGFRNLYLIREATGLEKTVAKMCVQARSTATPFLHKNDLMRPVLQQIASREAVQKTIELVKDIDPQVFTRKLLKETVDLEPYVILVTSYANYGTCWEAFDRLERTQSRGRIVIPLYAPNTQRAVLTALANYRWETAKLAAGGYWLEKGLTGGFYDLYRKLNFPGKNEQQAFVAAYCQWIEEESRGQMRFHPELRQFFWREIPFEQKRAELLAKYFAQFRDLAKE